MPRLLCKCYAILYKELEHLWILVSTGALGPIAHGYWGLTVLCAVFCGRLFILKECIHCKINFFMPPLLRKHFGWLGASSEHILVLMQWCNGISWEVTGGRVEVIAEVELSSLLSSYLVYWVVVSVHEDENSDY